MNKWLNRSVLAFAALILATGSGAIGVASPAVAVVPVDHVALANGMDLDDMLPQMCLSCSPCGKRGHEHGARIPPTGGRAAFHPHPCLEGIGCGSHPKCGMGSEVMSRAADLIESLKTSTPAQLAATVERYPHRMHVNAARGALQLIGCNDQIVASYSYKSIPALKALL